MKIIHISDTHLGYEDNAARFRRVIQDIHRVVGSSTDYVVVHTGDLIDKEAKSENELGVALLNELSSRNVSQGALPVLLCPGNHDYGCSWYRDEDRAKKFREAFGSFIFGNETCPFPVVIGNCVFIGLDSSWAELGFPKGLFAQGLIGREQLAALSEILDDPKIRALYKVIYLHHHPFLDSYAVRPDTGDPDYWQALRKWYFRGVLRLKDASSLLHCIRDRVDLLLFGHKHFGLDHCTDGRRYGIPIALDASSTTATLMATDRMRYRIVDTSTGLVECRVVSFLVQS
ncbi:MAG: metallophosphoesterase [Proteobacteria bacterium]|nr:metallophosphoesterase [Pseudomonadota bacterium]